MSPGTDSPLHLKIIKISQQERIKEITDIVTESIKLLEDKLSEATKERKDLRKLLGEVT